MRCTVIKECTDHLLEACCAGAKETSSDCSSKRSTSQKKRSTKSPERLNVNNDTTLCELCPNWASGTFTNCIERIGRDSIIPCEEEGRKYYLYNKEQKQVILYHVDEGVIKSDKDGDKPKRCDYLYIIGDKNKYEAAILVELKGRTISEAYTQLHETIKNYEGYLALFSRVYTRVVPISGKEEKTTKMKNFRAPKVKFHRPFLENFTKEHGGNLKVKEKTMREDYTSESGLSAAS